MGEDGVCRTMVKENADVTIKEAKENSEVVLSLNTGEKFPILVDTVKIRSMSKEARDFLSLKNRPSPVNAIALVIGSPISRVIGNFFIGLNKSRVPNKLFTSEKKAITWILKFVEK